ncbi:MAG: hypothetical protein KR126chlam2_00958 [Chlamydiae bacterium]|nr:hypothetical protein [Chlamydiota bacterium]
MTNIQIQNSGAQAPQPSSGEGGTPSTKNGYALAVFSMVNGLLSTDEAAFLINANMLGLIADESERLEKIIQGIKMPSPPDSSNQAAVDKYEFASEQIAAEKNYFQQLVQTVQQEGGIAASQTDAAVNAVGQAGSEISSVMGNENTTMQYVIRGIKRQRV